MAFQVIGYGGAVADVGGDTFRALRVSVMPIEYGNFGVYRFSATTSPFTGSASGTLWSFRWGDAFRLAVLLRLICDGVAQDAAGLAGINHLRAFIARSFTASDSGGAALTLTGNNGKLRTNMGATLLTDLRMSTTATLTAGTRTVDTQPIGELLFNATVGQRNQIPPATVLFNEDPSGAMPVILGQNEGVLVNLVMVGSAIVTIGLTSVHAEVTAY